MRRQIFALAIVIFGVVAATATAAETGHFMPGLPNFRDLAVPEPGFYGALYSYNYFTDRINDANGNKISSVTVTGPGGRSVSLSVDLNVKVYALAPMFIWVPKTKIFGARYGAYITPSFTNSNINSLLAAAGRTGQSLKTGQLNIADTFVQPLWLGWTGAHYDVSYGYGFYIPTGSYKINTLTLPVIGNVRSEAPDNAGLGFWTNQNQGALYLYPWKDRRLAIQNALTWEIHRKKRGFDITPGQNLTYNWGLTQFLPINKDKSLLAEVGPIGYNSLQVTNDSGTAALNPALHDRVHAVGVQFGVTHPKRGIVLNFRWLHEYSAVDRFQGSSIGFNFAIKL